MVAVGSEAPVVASASASEKVAAGVVPRGPVVVFDFDNYYLAGVIAEHLANQGIDTCYVTTAGNASAWTFMTNELPLVHRALVKADVQIHTLRRVTAFDGETVNPDTLRAVGLVHKHGLVKVLGRGELTHALDVSAHAFSASAVQAIEAAGGRTTVLPPPFGNGRPPAKGNALTNR